MLGIGLGGFVDGFAKGYSFREEMKDREQARLDRAEDREFMREQRQWSRDDRAFQQSERDRALGERKRIDAINADARAQFDAGVESGTYKPDEFEKFWAEYALPRMQTELILQNDYQGAQALADWSATNAAKKGRQLFSSALFKAQTGDGAGALDDAIEAGRIAGYIGDGFDISDKEEITDKKGNVLGYRLTIKDAQGNEAQQDVALEDIPDMVTRFSNPQTAWESQQATRASNAKRASELEDYEAKKQIDARYSTSSDKSRSDAIKALRDRYKADPFDASAVGFDDMPREEQERLIAGELELQSGTQRTAPPAARVVVDTQSGQPMAPTPSAQPRAAAPGLGESPRPVAQQAPGITPRPSAVINGQDSGLPAPTTPAEMVDMAARQMVEGGDPQEIARTLKAMGVPEHKWPDSVKRPLQQRATDTSQV